MIIKKVIIAMMRVRSVLCIDFKVVWQSKECIGKNIKKFLKTR